MISARSTLRNWLAYAIFAAAFVPLVFGGKIYKVMEKIMVAKVIVVLGYLLFLGHFLRVAADVGGDFWGVPGLGLGRVGTGGFGFADRPSSAAAATRRCSARSPRSRGRGG